MIATASVHTPVALTLHGYKYDTISNLATVVLEIIAGIKQFYFWQFSSKFDFLLP